MYGHPKDQTLMGVHVSPRMGGGKVALSVLNVHLSRWQEGIVVMIYHLEFHRTHLFAGKWN
jgi:hypothetical protein